MSQKTGNRLLGRRDSRLVAVEDQNHLPRQSLQNGDMRFRQSGPQRGDRIQNTSLMGLHAIGIPLHHQCRTRPFDRVPGDIQRVTNVTLRKNDRFRTVEILGIWFTGGVGKNPSPECNSASSCVVNRKHHPINELIVIAGTTVTFLRQRSANQQFGFVAAPGAL